MSHVLEKANNEISYRYWLPLMSIREISPQRYDLEFEAQGCKYSIGWFAEGKLSNIAIVCNTTLYFTNIPKTTKEALKEEFGKGAMEEEIFSLQKNKAWKKCVLLRGKKAACGYSVLSILLIELLKKQSSSGSTGIYSYIWDG